MIVTAAEFQSNFQKYLQLLQESHEDILITENGKAVAQVSNANKNPETKVNNEADSIRREYQERYGQNPDEWAEYWLEKWSKLNSEDSPVEALCGLLKGVAPEDIDRKQIREMRLQERYGFDNA